MNLFFKTTFLIIGVCIINAFSVNAQKLPNVQTAGVRAPANIKIDGKTNEWNDKFQAYNVATDVYYSISNDDDNLYLSLQARDEAVIKKIINKGIVLSLGSGTQKAEENFSLSFPAPIELSTLIKLVKDKNKGGVSDTKKNKSKVDSLVNDMNTIIKQNFKEIKITGTNVNNDKIPIYNDIGILAAVRIDESMFYNYELAVPLKYVAPVINKDLKINYNIKLEGLMTNRTNIVFIVESDYSKIVNYTTDFSGEYALAK